MLNLIDRLETLLRQCRPDYYQKLLPGLTPNDLLAFEQFLGFSVPSSYRSLYLWRNGQPPSYSKAFQMNQTWMCNQEVKEKLNILNTLLRIGDFDRAHWWSSHWIPFLSNGGGDHFCVDMEGTFTGQVGQILEFRHDNEERLIVAPSMETWLADYITMLEREDWEYYRVTGETLFLYWKCSLSDYPIRQRAS